MIVFFKVLAVADVLATVGLIPFLSVSEAPVARKLRKVARIP
jgi:hypothetical protein